MRANFTEWVKPENLNRTFQHQFIRFDFAAFLLLFQHQLVIPLFIRFRKIYLFIKRMCFFFQFTFQSVFAIFHSLLPVTIDENSSINIARGLRVYSEARCEPCVNSQSTKNFSKNCTSEERFSFPSRSFFALYQRYSKVCFNSVFSRSRFGKHEKFYFN